MISALAFALALGPETEVSTQPTRGLMSVEPSIALQDNVIAVAWNDTYGFKTGASTGSAAAYAFSTDGGNTYQFGGYVEERNGVVSGADTRLAPAGQGKFLLCALSWHEARHALNLYEAAPGRPAKLLAAPDVTNGTPYLDKPAMAVDERGEAHLAYTRGGVISYVRSLASRSKYSKPLSVSHEEAGGRSGAGIAVAGQLVVVGWVEGGMAGFKNIWAAVSEDSGATFSAPKQIGTLGHAVPSPSGFRAGVGRMVVAFNDVCPAITKSGQIYLTTAEGLPGEGCRPMLFSSSDKGRTWKKESVPQDLKFSFFPSMILVDDEPALLSYYRSDPADDETHVRLDWRSGGEWSNQFVSSKPSKWSTTEPDTAGAMIQRNFGDYISLCAQGKKMVAAWTDGRSGRPRIVVRPLQL